MDFFWILVVIGLISTIISAVAKSKKREEARRESEGQPAPPRPLSDIQKAVMMAQETASQRPAAPPRPAYTPQQPGTQPNPVYAQQYVAQPRPAYTPQQPAAYTPMEARTTAPMEARSAAPMEARTAAAVPPHPMYSAPRAAGTLPADFYSGSMGAATTEGQSDNTDIDKPMEVVRVSALESVTDADLETAAGLNTPAKPLQQAAVSNPQPKREPLKLFDGKNEVVKAVIYSEVLARRSPGRRTGRA
jgi:hypothetical protein